MVMLPWLVERKRVKLSDMAEQFKLTEAELVDDIMMASVCGVPPYSPDALIDVFVDEDEVVADVPLMFSRPLQLNSAEVFALTVMGKAALRLPGANKNGPLATALKKLRPLLPSGDGVVEVDLKPVAFLEELRNAVAPGAHLLITYFTPATAARSERTIIPRSVFERGGHWYVSADDDKSGELREFRVDRIESLNATGNFSEPDATTQRSTDGSTWFDNADLHVTLRVEPSARWVIESYPYMSRQVNEDGSTLVTMAVGSEHWLSRLLLRAGDGVQVQEPLELQDLAKRTAAQMLLRYA
jgi:proteasome accessory factor C